MCGILAVHHVAEDIEAFKPKALHLSKQLRHRGPDWSGKAIRNQTILCHERLAIVGVESGAQPLVSDDGKLVLTVNGEIYNHLKLRENLKGNYKFKTYSDCEVILYLYREHGPACANMLDGMFSWVLYDQDKDKVVAARDPIGITTLYQGFSSDSPDTAYFASELKALHPVCDKIIAFPPGHYYDSETKQTVRYFKPSWWDENKIPSNPVDYKLLRETLEASVRKRLMAEVPYGVLLSGGLDSSLIASIAARETEKLANSTSQSEEARTITAWPKLHSFAIGLPGSPDLLAARKVADFLHTFHHEHTFTIDEGLDALRDVIYHLETYDVTTIRASTPMYLLSRKIKAQGVKMVLSGEGSDEIFGGYLYFGNAPSREAFHSECVRRVKNLHLSDCLRANKSTMAWGLEARVPFLDKDFLEVALNIDPEEKMYINGRKEKYILRKAFDTTHDSSLQPYLPQDILWRQKEQFSDGVGYSWIDALKDTAELCISDDEFALPRREWGDDIPTTKEAFWYRKLFDEIFPRQCADTVMRWVPKAEWGCPEDPSGRYQAGHVAALK
ncbi:putative asparagine synthetase [glutamine-hydrolyzing] [Schizosaccharomyces pombe]|uniref:Probable asparagine synthetase [glutamine-hydrolyzing] n=1 Tax=Schizosaccharomyces pombe (strain 972 / ATCC 24843) TaxID=284812 RepID=ASNS_SCHPO|nr:asparagine synthetase [Schizosaccharomyces pombe]P78753.3 RecName: Full=Probable asparagine synthetase [glutamine-hydrolyzing]; AltName: Full=Glutamine-dependent asparagine synthetase [Schizosaccharomyces pombe 972h-]CAA17925.1 asparagine synthetase [Schizosaccharomyces pombe]|eukprot:NP_001342717.1 asparagine synthetase [Schizosaccharomyces pombe]